MKKLFKFLKDVEGISSVEYAILLAFIAAAIVTAVVALSDTVVNRFQIATDDLAQ